MKQVLTGFLALLLLTACGGGGARSSGSRDSAQTTARAAPSGVVEVLYFHGKQRCVTCNAIEQLTREVVDSLADAQVVMRVVDITQQEALANKYEVTWSSLILDRDGKVENLTKMGFTCAKGQPALFKAKLAEAIATLRR